MGAATAGIPKPNDPDRNCHTLGNLPFFYPIPQFLILQRWGKNVRAIAMTVFRIRKPCICLTSRAKKTASMLLEIILLAKTFLANILDLTLKLNALALSYLV